MAIHRVTWGEARKQIKRACNENPEVSYLKVFKDFRDGFCQIWAYENLIFVTRVDKERDGKSLVLCLLAGSDLLKDGYQLEKDLHGLAKAYNCTKVKVTGRKGWERLLTPLGFKLQTIDMVKHYEQQNENRHHYTAEQTRSPYGRAIVWRQWDTGPRQHAIPATGH